MMFTGADGPQGVSRDREDEASVGWGLILPCEAPLAAAHFSTAT